MKLRGFKNFDQYTAESFEEQQNVSFKAKTAANSGLYFECKSPRHSVLLTDPVLEVNFTVAVQKPTKIILNNNMVQMRYVDGSWDDSAYMLSGGAFTIQSNCASITQQFKGITVHDDQLSSYLDAWHSLNHTPALKTACEATGSHALSYAWNREPVRGGYVDARIQEQQIINDKGQRSEGWEVGDDVQYIVPKTISIAQRQNDPSVTQKIYSQEHLTILEPLVTGLFKGSVKDESVLNGKSPFLAWDDIFRIRFKFDNIGNIFETYQGPTLRLADNFYTTKFTGEITSAYLHVQFARPRFDIPRQIRYAWPRFRNYTMTHEGDQKLQFPVIRVGSMPSALMISHRIIKDNWWQPGFVPVPIMNRGCYIDFLSIRNNLTTRNIYMEGTQVSKRLQFYTKRSFPHYPPLYRDYKHNQVVGLSRADLNLSRQADRVLDTEGFIEMQIEMGIGIVKDDDLNYEVKDVEVTFPDNEILLPSLYIDVLEELDREVIHSVQDGGGEWVETEATHGIFYGPWGSAESNELVGQVARDPEDTQDQYGEWVTDSWIIHWDPDFQAFYTFLRVKMTMIWDDKWRFFILDDGSSGGSDYNDGYGHAHTILTHNIVPEAEYNFEGDYDGGYALLDTAATQNPEYAFGFVYLWRQNPNDPSETLIQLHDDPLDSEMGFVKMYGETVMLHFDADRGQYIYGEPPSIALGFTRPPAFVAGEAPPKLYWYDQGEKDLDPNDGEVIGVFGTTTPVNPNVAVPYVPQYQTTVTLVYCDRFVKQVTADMYRREKRTAL